MSFSKSKVSRFGDKDSVLQKTSTTDFKSGSRDSNRSNHSNNPSAKFNGSAVLENADHVSAKIPTNSASFDNNQRLAVEKEQCAAPISLIEARTSPSKENSKQHSCLTRIGRPNLKRTGTGIKPKSAKDEILRKTSRGTVESSKSGPPTSRIPSIFGERSNSKNSSRASSFVGTPKKSADFANKRNIEVQYNAKAKRLAGMKRDLIEKQKQAIEVYRGLLMLRNKFKDINGKELPLEELKIVDCPEFKVLDQQQKTAEEERLRDIKKELNDIPSVFLNLCRQILDEKCSILDKTFDDENKWNQDEFMKQLHNYKEQTTCLAGKIESKLMEEEGKLREIIKTWYNIAKDHMGSGVCPLTYGSDVEHKLQDTEMKLAQALADLQLEKTKKNKEVFDRNRTLENEMGKLREKLAESQKALEEERNKFTCHKERHAHLEHKLKQAKVRMKDAETLKQELESQIANLNAVIQKNADEWKRKEGALEIRYKALDTALESHKTDVEKLERERHAVDVRAQELQTQFQVKEQQLFAKMKSQDIEIERLTSQLNNLETENNSLKIKTVSSEVYTHMHDMIRKKIETGDFLDNSAIKSATEMTLWKELKETQSSLKLAEEKLAIYAEEKTRFLNTISEHYQEDESAVNMTQKLMQKEELISTLILRNKQLQETLEENNVDYEQQQENMKEIEEKYQSLNEQLFTTDVNTEKEIYDMHLKLNYEVEQNKTLQVQLEKAQNEQTKMKETILDYENLLKIRDGLLNMMQEKREATEEQNNSLKDYIVQMREQLNLMGIDKSKKEQELKTLTILLEEKTGYIDKIEERVLELESSVQELKTKRTRSSINLKNSPRLPKPPESPKPPELEIEVLQETSSKNNLEQFISHAQNLHSQELLRHRKRLNRRHGQSNLCRSHPYHCTSETKIMTTVSDIMRRYKSTEGFDLKEFTSSSDFSIFNE